MTIVVNFGAWGGVYTKFNSFTWRVCLGFVAFTIYWFDLDVIMVKWAKETGNYADADQ